MQNKTWQIKKLIEVCEIIRSGIAPFEGEKEYIDTNSVQNFSIVKSTLITYKNRPSRANMEAKANDVLVAKMANTVKVYLATLQDEEKRIFSTGFFVLRPKKELIEPKYLFFYCASNFFQNLKDELARGSTQKALNDEKLKRYFEIPLPPLEIQKRIVARIEELFEKIDKAKELREKVLEETEEIFPAVIEEIFSKCKKKNWKCVPLEDVLKEDRKSINPQDFPNKRFWLVTMDCIESHTGRLIKEIESPGSEIKSMKFLFNSSHILYGKLRPYLNKVFIPSKEGICTTEFIPFFVKNADREFVGHCLRSNRVMSFAMQNLTGTRQPRVNIKSFLKYQIPLPPLSEQKRIVAYLDNLREKIEKLKQLQQKQLEELTELKNSILEKAFKGELIK